LFNTIFKFLLIQNLLEDDQKKREKFVKDKFDLINELDMNLSEDIESQVKSRESFEKKMT